MGACNELSYCLLAIFNLVLLIASAAAAALAGINLAEVKLTVKGVALETLTDLLPRDFLLGMLVVSGVVFVTALLGCFGSSKTKQMANDYEDGFDPNETPCHRSGHCALSLYIIIMIFLFLVSCAMTALILHSAGKLNGKAELVAQKGQTLVDNEISPRIDAVIEKFLSTKEETSRIAWADAQDKFKCCGLLNAHDSKPRDSSGNNGTFCTTKFVPHPHVNSTSHQFGGNMTTSGEAPTPTCAAQIFAEIVDKSKLVSYMGFGSLGLMMACIIAAVELRCCSISKVEPEDGSSGGLDRRDSELQAWEER